MATNEELLKRIEQLERDIVQINKAFMKDDVDDVDYGGHRLAHIAWKKRMEFFGSLKYKAILAIATPVALILGHAAWDGIKRLF